MTTDADNRRCDGQPWPDFGVQPQCIDCERRIMPPIGHWSVVIEAPKEQPCPQRRESK